MANGIAITQEGIDVENASDYQKVLDSRWLFFEVLADLEETITIPDLGTPSTNGYQRVNIVRHGATKGGRPFVPAFHSGWKREEAFVDFDDQYVYENLCGVAADDEYIYFYRRYLSGYNTPAFTVSVNAKVYNIPILEDYLAPIEVAPLSFKRDTGIGIRALDSSNATTTIESHASTGFSIDTRKKILSIHKVMQKNIDNSGGADDSRIPHDNTYPPSYMFCSIIDNINGAGQAVKPLYHISVVPLVSADNTYLYFKGVQSVYKDHIAVIIIKDPIEVAQ